MNFKRTLTLDDVYHLVYEYFGVDPKHESSKREYAQARQIAIYLMRSLDVRPSYRELSEYFGRYYHDFSKMACYAAEILAETSHRVAIKHLKENMQLLEKRINSGELDVA